MCFIVLNNTYSQTLNDYEPDRIDEQAKVASIITLNKNYTALLQNLPTEYKDKYKALLKEMKLSKKEGIANDLYLFNSTFSQFFDNILKEIKQANPYLPIQDISFYVSRDYSPNALTSIDGSIAFNLSLLSNCKNESQVAFVICHELAHYQLRHPSSSVKKMFDLIYSPKGQKEIKEISQLEYNTYEKAEEYLKTIIYDSRRHVRGYEDQADSLALQLLLKTKFDAKESIQCLLMLDKIDSLLFSSNFDLSKIFDSPDYKFKSKWIEEEETLFKKGKRVFDSSFHTDSLKTHPSCLKRAALLSEYLQKEPLKGNTNYPIIMNFDEIKTKATYETIIATYDFGRIDYCLFQTLNLLQTQPDNIFLCAQIGQCLNTIYDAQRDHNLSKIVAITDNDKPEAYKKYLRFLNNLSLNEIAAVNFYFLKNLDKKNLNNEFFLFNILTASKNINQMQELEKYKALYIEKFPKGKFIEVVSSY